MIPDPLLKKLIETIHSEPELAGSVVGFYGNNHCRTLHQGRNPRKIVIIEEIVPGRPDERNGRHVPQRTDASPQILDTPPPVVTNRSVIGREMFGAGLSCGMAVVSGLAIAGGTAAAPVSGGASTVLVVAAWTGFVTSGLQCINGLVRVGTAIVDPNDNDLQRWDENTYYSVASLIVDALGIASSLAALPAASKGLFQALQHHGKMKHGFEALSKMDRATRGRLVRESLKEATRTQEGRRAIEAALKNTALTNKQVANVLKSGADSGRRSSLVMGSLRKESAVRLHRSLTEILLGAPVSLAISGTPPAWTGSGSGVVYKFGSWAGNGLGNIMVHVIEK